MKVSQLISNLGLKTIAAGNLDREITNCYICDMLSYVMARAQYGDAWITVQTNVNVVAVAALADCACVIVPEDIPVEPATVKRAAEHEVTILSAPQTAFEIAYEIGKNILQQGE